MPAWMVLREIALQVEVPDLHGTQPVIRVDAVGIRRRCRLGASSTVSSGAAGLEPKHGVVTANGGWPASCCAIV